MARNSPSSKRRSAPYRILGLLLIAISVVGLMSIAFVIPMPYVIESPGPTFNVLGKVDNHQVITIKKAKTYPAEGSLRMVTVSLRGGPESHISGIELLVAALDKRNEVLPEEQVYPKGITREEVTERSNSQMTSAQQNAEVAALAEQGIEVPGTQTISGFVDDSPNIDALQVGDQLVSIKHGDETIQLDTATAIFQVLRQIPAGSTLELTVLRSGTEKTVKVTTVANQEGAGSLLGIYLNMRLQMPVDINISLEDVGGPSAGMMFALGILDLMTPGDLTGGADIAGTGTISVTGEVGAISGVVQKIHGAADDGADFFLIPQDNCRQMRGAKLPDIRVVPVRDLRQARDIVTKISNGKTGGMPSCPAR